MRVWFFLKERKTKEQNLKDRGTGHSSRFWTQPFTVKRVKFIGPQSCGTTDRNTYMQFIRQLCNFIPWKLAQCQKYFHCQKNFLSVYFHIPGVLVCTNKQQIQCPMTQVLFQVISYKNHVAVIRFDSCYLHFPCDSMRASVGDAPASALTWETKRGREESCSESTATQLHTTSDLWFDSIRIETTALPSHHSIHPIVTSTTRAGSWHLGKEKIDERQVAGCVIGKQFKFLVSGWYCQPVYGKNYLNEIQNSQK